MPESKPNAGGMSLKILIPVGALVFFLSTWFSYSFFHHQEANVPGKTSLAQAARVLEPVANPAENERAPSGVASGPVGSGEPTPSQALSPESAPAQTAEPKTQVETAALKPQASPEKSPEAAATSPGKTEIAKAAPAKTEAENQAIPVLTQRKKEEVAKAPAGKNKAPLKLQIGEYPDLKSMIQDLNRVKELGFATAFEEKEMEGAGKDYFLVLNREFNEGEANADSLKLKVIHKLENKITPQSGGKDQIWIGPFAKLTEAIKTTKMLKDEGYDTRVEMKKKPGKKIYLFAGPFDNKMNMIKAKAVLEKNGFSPEAPALP